MAKETFSEAVEKAAAAHHLSNNALATTAREQLTLLLAKQLAERVLEGEVAPPEPRKATWGSSKPR